MIGMSCEGFMDLGKAFGSAGEIFSILDRSPQINANPTVGKKKEVNGNVDLVEAEFHYPSRPTMKVLNKMNLKIQQGESIALVGPSGCGKSTVIQLIQRFYDLDNGVLMLDENNITNLNVPFV